MLIDGHSIPFECTPGYPSQLKLSKDAGAGVFTDKAFASRVDIELEADVDPAGDWLFLDYGPEDSGTAFGFAYRRDT
jgi:hypothetical protein